MSERKAALANLVGKRVLLVDDEPFYFEVYGKPLEKAGCLVTYASDGEKAAHLINKKEFDLIIVDLIMPIVSGMHFLKGLKQRRRKAIVLTSMESDTDREDALQLGVKFFLIKAETPATKLLEAVRQLLIS